MKNITSLMIEHHSISEDEIRTLIPSGRVAITATDWLYSEYVYFDCVAGLLLSEDGTPHEVDNISGNSRPTDPLEYLLSLDYNWVINSPTCCRSCEVTFSDILHDYCPACVS